MLLAVAALATALVYVVGRESDVVERSEAVTAIAQEQPADAAQQGDRAETEPLTLTLSAPTTCEAERVGQNWVWGPVIGDDGVERNGAIFLDEWSDVEEVNVTWTVSGGTAPYTLTIDGETRDHVGDYVGASGTASASCGSETSGASIVDPAPGWGQPKERRYRTDPQVEAGLKTIHATVTDATGTTAETTAHTHVILELGAGGDRLESGETYRVLGFLVTVPDGMTLEIGEMSTSHNGGTWVSLRVVGTAHRSWIWLSTTTGEEAGRYYYHGRYGLVGTDGTVPQTYEEELAGMEPERIDVPDMIRRIDVQFDELVESINRIPTVKTVD